MQQTIPNKIEAIWRGSKAKIIAAVLIVAGASLFSVNARAACGGSIDRLSGLASPSDLPALTSDLEENATTQQQPERDTESASRRRLPAIVGLWLVKFYSGGQLFDQGFDQFHSDGLEILNDIAPPVPPSSSGTICLGVWKEVDHNTIKLRHPAWVFDANANLSAGIVILETITVDANRNSYSGTFTYQVYDPDFKNLISETKGEVKAHRVTVD
jgi:hypothetical protein